MEISLVSETFRIENKYLEEEIIHLSESIAIVTNFPSWWKHEHRLQINYEFFNRSLLFIGEWI